jgi:hypothetical protein
MSTLPPKLRRTLEVVYAIDGVAGARVWEWPGTPGAKTGPRVTVAVGVRPSPTASPGDLLRRVEAAVAGLREPDEAWEFGILEEAV